MRLASIGLSVERARIDDERHDLVEVPAHIPDGQVKGLKPGRFEVRYERWPPSVEFGFEFTRPVDRPVAASVSSTSLMSCQGVHYLSGNVN